MTTAEKSVGMPNSLVNIVADSEDMEDDIRVRRRSKINVLHSDDEEDDRNVGPAEIQVEQKEVSEMAEVIGSERCVAKNQIVDCSDKEIDDQLSSDCLNTLKKLEGINNNICKGVDLNIPDPRDLIPSESSTTVLPAKDLKDEEQPYLDSKRFRNILDSDSEDERMFESSVNKKQSPSYDRSQHSRSISVDSDSSIESRDNKMARPVLKPRKVVNGESEDEGEIEDQRETSAPKELEDIGTTLNPTENFVGKTSNNKISKPNKISTLIDTDSEEENSASHILGGSSDEGERMTKSNAVKKKGKPEKKKRTGSIRAAKEEAMREIRSETQRMLRESQVRLPYHRPKQHTLQEFLNRRKCLPTLPETLTTAAKIKMSGEIIGKYLEEKAKEAELFYKSSSDSDSEAVSQAELAIASVKQRPKAVENNVDNASATEETQKVPRSDLKNSQGVKEVIQQGDKSIGIPRKLFNSSENESEATEAASPIQTSDSEGTTKEIQNSNQRRKEIKQGLKEISIPRKLFVSEFVESMDIENEESNMPLEGHDKIEEIHEVREVHNSQMKVLNNSDQFVKKGTIDTLANNSKGQKNKSMEEETEDFELKMSEDPCEMMNDDKFLGDIAIPKTSTVAFETITVTPFINNREVSKLNETEQTDSELIIADGNLASDNKMKSKDIEISSAEDEQSLSVNNISSCNNVNSEVECKPIGHVYGLPLPEFDHDKLEKIKTRIPTDIMRLTPKLQGTPDMVIELSPPKVGVNQLIKRFLNHSVAKKTSGPEVSAIRTEQTASGLKVINEVLPYRIPINERNDDPELSKPGAKLIRLKEGLQQQMAIQRAKEWKQKELEMKTSEGDDTYCDERSDCGLEEEDDVEEKEDEEEEEGGKDESSDGEESEPDENDLPIKDGKNKYKSPFLDAEAEVSEEDSEDEEEADVCEEDDVGTNIGFVGNNKEEEQEESETEAIQSNKTLKFKRIMKAFQDDDSNDAEVKETDPNAHDTSSARHFRKTKTDDDMFATDNNSDDDWLSGTDGDLPVYQQRIDEQSQFYATPSVANNSLSIISPITQLTALNTGSDSLNADTKLAQNPLQTMGLLSVETTPIEVKCYRECNSEKREKLQKKLFDDIRETPNDTELMSLCSGQFPDNPTDGRELDKLINTAKKTTVSNAELLDLCSGTFATQAPDIKKLEACSEKVQSVAMSSNTRSFPSPDKSSEELTQKPDKISSTAKIVLSSDDEDDTRNSQVKNARGQNLKKKVRKLKLSDDEEESDNMSLSDLDERDDDEAAFVDYDSEENEIVVPKKDVRKVAARFLDEEAELSESEWGSADEDERDLDKLDWEEGDLEDIDQDQVKKQLEKIHMRQVLDADQREVRLLQELLLEDGELHSDGTSRQRKFKWKNIDELGEDGEGNLQNEDEEDVVDPNEAESELEWRKRRLERERFLQEQRMKEAAADVGEEKEDSQLFQLGMKILKKNKNTKVPDKDISQSIVVEESQTHVARHTLANLFASPGCGKKTFALQKAIHRGSFLARGEESLARLSAITRQNSDSTILRTKNSRNFVFTHLSPAIETSIDGEELNDEKNTATMETRMRKRKSAFSLTPVASKKSKKEYKQSTTRNKLFN